MSAIGLGSVVYYLHVEGTIKRDDYSKLLKVIQRTYPRGKAPLEFNEVRVKYVFKTDRQEEVLHFISRQTNVGRRYSIRYQGMANRTKGMIQVGIGQEFECSEEGGGFIQEMGFVPMAKRTSHGYQWCVGEGIYLEIFEKKGDAKDPKSDGVCFELFSFCPNEHIDRASYMMETTIRLLQPYAHVPDEELK
ncbi:hypothetical protein WA577_000658 [Blastocystis sp. JDR]